MPRSCSQPSRKGGELRVGGLEGRRVRDSRRAGPGTTSDRPSAGTGERPARREADEPVLGVEHVEQRREVVLVGAATVQEDQRALRLARGLADDVDEWVPAPCGTR